MTEKSDENIIPSPEEMLEGALGKILLEEVLLEMLLEYIRDSSKFWAELPDKTPRERCDGLAFSILSVLDGCSPDIPMFILKASVHPAAPDQTFNGVTIEQYLHEHYYE